MFYTLIISAISLLITRFILVRSNRRFGKHYPPGPFTIPVFGNLLNFSLAGDLGIERLLMKYANKYGKVFAVNFGDFRSVMISDVKMAREAFSNMDLFLRPAVDSLTITNNGKFRGMFVNDESHLREQRKFTIRQLVNQGFGKKCMESIIVEEAEDILKNLEKEAGKPIQMQNRFNINILNVIWRIINSGKRFAHDDPELVNVIQTITACATETKSMALFFLPWVTKLAPRLSGWNHMVESGKTLFTFLKNQVDMRAAAHEEGDTHDFMAVYLEQIRTCQDPSSSFYGEVGLENLCGVLGDAFVAGAETTSTSISWAFLYLALNPDKQEKLQKEIDQVLKGEFPTLADRRRMPYLETVVLETLRHSSAAPLGLPHYSSKDTHIGDYFIPKDTIVLANFYGMHHDPELWGQDVNDFKPERFLAPLTIEDGDETNAVDENGNDMAEGFKLLPKHESFNPFSFGKRNCPAEVLARDEMFIVVSSVLQKFSVTWNNAKKRPTIDAKFSFSRSPLPHELIFTRREEQKN